jgi:hypothetical protein
MEPAKEEPGSRSRDIGRAIEYLEQVDHDRFVEGGTNTEISSIILARMGKNVRTIKNIVVFWFILFILFLLFTLGVVKFGPTQTR